MSSSIQKIESRMKTIQRYSYCYKRKRNVN